MLCHYLLDDFTAADSVDDIKLLLKKAQRSLGFTSYTFFSIPFIRSDHPFLFTLDQNALMKNLDFTHLHYLTDNDALVADISRKSFFDDPRFRCALIGLDRYPWNINTITHHENFLKLMQENSIKGGLTIPYLYGNRQICILNFHFDREITDSDTRVFGDFVWLGQVLHARIMQLMRQQSTVKYKEQVQELSIDELLSCRQIEVVKLVCEGKGNKSIADELEISTSMVQRHIGDSMKKLKCSNRTELSFRFKKGLGKKPKSNKIDRDSEILSFGSFAKFPAK